MRASLVAQTIKNRPAMQEETRVQSLGWKIPWRRVWQPAPVFLPGEFHGQRSPRGYSPRGRKESDLEEVKGGKICTMGVPKGSALRDLL